MWASNDKRWLFFGIPLIGLSVASLAYLLIWGQPAMDHPGHGRIVEYSGILIMDTAPEWVADDMQYTRKRMEDPFSLPERIEETNLAPELCTQFVVELDKELTFPCRTGWITVMPLTLDLVTCTPEDCHAGLAVWDVSGPEPKCTVFVPHDVESLLRDLAHAGANSDLSNLQLTSLRSDIENVDFAHEVVHCIRGKGHVSTRLFGPFTSAPTGALMNSNINKAGWSFVGLEQE